MTLWFTSLLGSDVSQLALQLPLCFLILSFLYAAWHSIRYRLTKVIIGVAHEALAVHDCHELEMLRKTQPVDRLR